MDFIVKHFSELSVEELYEILKTRFEIFVTEQECIYQDLDDNDLRDGKDRKHTKFFCTKTVHHIKITGKGHKQEQEESEEHHRLRDPVQPEEGLLRRKDREDQESEDTDDNDQEAEGRTDLLCQDPRLHDGQEERHVLLCLVQGKDGEDDRSEEQFQRSSARSLDERG